MPGLNNELQEYLEAMGAEGFGQVPIADVGNIVDAIMSSLDGDLTAEDVIRFNGGNKMTLSEATPSDADNPDRPAVPSGSAELLQGEIFPAISDDLAAVGDRLQDAAQRILASTEKVEALMDNLKPEQAGVLLDAITEIYSACGFEDITGQTIDRVMGKLRQIEYESERLLAAMGNKEAKKRTEQLEKEIESEMVRQEEQLLHGPDSMKEANSQEEIDKILASFD